jgi:DNA repair protein RecO (recombination protein O)
MEWSDEGIVLAARRHGESGAIVTLLTLAHGRHAGLVRGGAGRRARGLYEPGNRVLATWRGRLSEHLGHFLCELSEAYAAALLDDPLRLAALSSATAVADAALPDREPHPAVYERLKRLLDRLSAPAESAAGPSAWEADYVRWELALLADLGFGLDLTHCAVTGATQGLAFVSPRSGRAVALAAAAPYADRLLALPGFLRDRQENATRNDVLAGLALTGHFLRRDVFAHRHDGAAANAEEPAARTRLVQRLRKMPA